MYFRLSVLLLIKLTHKFSKNHNKKLLCFRHEVFKAFNHVWHGGLLYKLAALDTPFKIGRIMEFIPHRLKLKNQNQKPFLDNQTNSYRSSTRFLLLNHSLFDLCSTWVIYDMFKTPETQLTLFTEETIFLAQNKNVECATIQLQSQMNR